MFTHMLFSHSYDYQRRLTECQGKYMYITNLFYSLLVRLSVWLHLYILYIYIYIYI